MLEVYISLSTFRYSVVIVWADTMNSNVCGIIYTNGMNQCVYMSGKWKNDEVEPAACCNEKEKQTVKTLDRIFVLLNE